MAKLGFFIWMAGINMPK